MKGVKGLVGLLLLLIGVGLAAGGALGIAAFGPSGTLETTSPLLRTGPKSYALVADVVGITAGFPGASSLGETTIGARSAGGQALFVGYGTRESVDEYLFGVPYDAIRQDGSDWETRPVPGTRAPADPAEEDLWLAQGTGSRPAITFKLPSTGAATLVVMNQDLTENVSAQITIGFRSGTVFPISVGAVVVGLLLAIEGVVLMRTSRRAKASEAAIEAPAPDHPAPPAPVSASPAAAPAITPEPAQPDAPTGDAAAPGPAPVGEVPAEDLPDDWFRSDTRS